MDATEVYEQQGWSADGTDRCYYLAMIATTASNVLNGGICVCEAGFEGARCAECAVGYTQTSDGGELDLGKTGLVYPEGLHGPPDGPGPGPMKNRSFGDCSGENQREKLPIASRNRAQNFRETFLKHS